MDVNREFEKFRKIVMGGIYEMLVLLIMKRIKKPTYGYEISKQLEIISNNSIHLTEGTLYPLLKKMERSKLIKSFWGESDVGPPRKYYELTEKGEAFLSKALDLWRVINNCVNNLLGE